MAEGAARAGYGFFWRFCAAIGGHGEVSVAIRRADTARIAFVTFAVTMPCTADTPAATRDASDRYNFIQI